jgi:anti-sigma-K factor RskA
MAQTKKKRSRKHRGTPAGNVERPARGSSSSRAKPAAKQTARDRRAERMNREPTWRGSVNRAGIAAVLFGLLAVLALDRDPAQAAVLVAFMFVVYIPLGYMTDKAVYNFRQRKRK